jgi:hypothetical protein
MATSTPGMGARRARWLRVAPLCGTEHRLSHWINITARPRQYSVTVSSVTLPPNTALVLGLIRRP